jgi:cysteine-S-conjugate beta-lyase
VSGLFSIVLKPVPQKAFDALLDAVKLLGMGYSWGGFESLKADLDRGFAALKATT